MIKGQLQLQQLLCLETLVFAQLKLIGFYRGDFMVSRQDVIALTQLEKSKKLKKTTKVKEEKKETPKKETPNKESKLK